MKRGALSTIKKKKLGIRSKNLILYASEWGGVVAAAARRVHYTVRFLCILIRSGGPSLCKSMKCGGGKEG
jgi:hypothetical protein